MTAPVLVFGWGNPARGDDALGPLFVERLAARWALPQIEWLIDFQLQVEHALDLAGRQHVLFVDASRAAPPPFEAGPLQACRDASLRSHALSPAALLQVFIDIGAGTPPPATLLAIRGDTFELGAPPGARAEAHLEQALAFGDDWLRARAMRPCDASPPPGDGA